MFSPTFIVLTCLVLQEIYGYEQVELTEPLSQANFVRLHNGRSRRQANGPPQSYFSSSSSYSEPFIPKIDPAPAGSILTYNGKAISTSIGAFSIVPRSERRTPSINRNRPQYATFRGELPPLNPDYVPGDLPQFRNNKGAISNFPPGFN